ncbi:MAG: aminotransferase class V-fold PLP-dependent enzyme, partial [Blastocatellia bacterium]
MNLSEVRDQFPALKKKVFLDAACVSLAPLTAIDAVKRFLDSAALCTERSATEHHIAMDDAMGRARPEAARLINASENEIALVESTSRGLSVAASSIPLERGDRVLICDLEFMEVAIPWVQRRDELGLEIDVVPHHKGELRVEDIAERIGPKTRVVAVSSVQWTNGYRVDLAALSKLCR